MPYTAAHKQETRQRIVASARRLFNRNGFNDVSIDEIMEDAGLTRGGFYKHFGAKDELYRAAVLQFARAARPHDRQRLFVQGSFRRPRRLVPDDRAAVGHRAVRRRREDRLPRGAGNDGVLLRGQSAGDRPLPPASAPWPLPPPWSAGWCPPAPSTTRPSPTRCATAREPRCSKRPAGRWSDRDALNENWRGPSPRRGEGEAERP